MTHHANVRRARSLRQDANYPERKAWETLRTLRKTHGLPVRRQHPIDRFTVDFAIRSKRLVIEIDGGVHGRPEVSERDVERDARLPALGWRVLRVPADIALSPDHLIEAVVAALVE